MPSFEIEFCYTQISRGIATINAQTLAQAEAIAEEMDAGDDRISFNPVDGEMCVIGVTKAICHLSRCAPRVPPSRVQGK